MKNTHKPILDTLLNISIHIKYVWFPQKKKITISKKFVTILTRIENFI